MESKLEFLFYLITKIYLINYFINLITLEFKTCRGKKQL